MKLIFVEGIPGSGKSTTARFISIQSERNGCKTRLYHESTIPHPILIHEEIADYTEWMNSYLANWDMFLEAHSDSRDDTIIVMESALFQSPILYLLHMDIEREEIMQYIKQLFLKLQPANCCLIYLYQEDPTIGIDRMMEDRGGIGWLNQTYEKHKDKPYYLNRGQHGAHLHLDFLHEYAELASGAYARCNINSLKIENTSWDWSAYRSRILTHFKWSFIPDPIIPEDELARFTGIFRNEEMNFNIQIELHGGELIALGGQRLKPKESHKFYLDHVSMLFHFICDINGEFNVLVIEEKDLVGNRNDDGTRFVKCSF